MRRGRRGACLVVASLVVLLAGCGGTVEGGGHASAPATVGSKRSLDRSSVEASDGLRARTAAAASAAGSYRATTTVTYADTVRTTLLVAVAEVEGQELGRGEGKTKKAAEQEAALHALDSLDEAAAS